MAAPRTIDLPTTPKSAWMRFMRALRKGVHSNPWGKRYLAWRLPRRAIAVNGHRMFLDPADSLRLYYRRIHEEHELRLIESRLKPGDFVLDIGAHVGYFTLAMARAVGPKGRVIAFEPNPQNFALLQRNVALNGYGNVTLDTRAVADKPGTAHLYLSGSNTGDHGLFDTEGGRPSVDVEMIRLDDYLAQTLGERAAEVCFIKMDIQGAEAAALEGMAGTLSRAPRLALLMEYSPFTLKSIGVEPASLLATLRGHGFTLFYRKSRKLPRFEELLNDGDLLAAYPPVDKKGNFTNLFCVKGEGFV